MSVRFRLQALALLFVVAFFPFAANAIEIGPISGLTTDWHKAPDSMSIPLYSVSALELRRHVAPAASITWTGATEVSRDGGYSVAELQLTGVGRHAVNVKYVFANGSQIEESVVFDVVAIGSEQIDVSPIRVWADPVDLDGDNLNTSTYEYFQGPSIAGLRQVSDRWYRTSTRRAVELSVEVDPPGFAPLMEWRTAGKPSRLGSSTSIAHTYPHIQQIDVGPTDDPQAVFLETYSVEITSHISNHDVIPEGVPVTFTAVTDPPGLEGEITWLASTKYGSCDPVMGQGPEFTVRFEDTWGLHPLFDEPFQWLGVKADHVQVEQDDKDGPFDIPPVLVHEFAVDCNSNRDHFLLPGEITTLILDALGATLEGLNVCVTLNHGCDVQILDQDGDVLGTVTENTVCREDVSASIVDLRCLTQADCTSCNVDWSVCSIPDNYTPPPPVP